MYAPIRSTLVPLAAVACLAATAARARAAHPLTVQDEAGMFSRTALSRANQTIADIKRRDNKDVLVQTRTSPPAGFEEANKRGKRAVRQFYAKWADARAEAARVSIFI